MMDIGRLQQELALLAQLVEFTARPVEEPLHAFRRTHGSLEVAIERLDLGLQ